VGYRWLAFLLDKQTGGLLADDMGLGKTVQVIAHMGRLAEENRLRPSLVVCPKTIIENWQRELRRFLPQQDVSVVTGGLVPADALAEQDVVLMSYDTLRCNQLEVAKVDWQMVVCDEAQYTKNPTAQRTTAVKALKSQHRVALTGTPVENGMIEFWCIMDFVRPGLLGCWSDFRSEYERPLVEAQDERAREPLVDHLLGKIGRHYMRRLKDEILRDLPPKTECVIQAALGPLQFELYRRIAVEGRTGGRGAALAAITKLLIVCAHPLAVDGDISTYRYQKDECPKLDAAIDALQQIRAAGQKALIFTRFLRVQRLLQAAIRQTFEVWPDVLNGDVTNNRQLIVDTFAEKPGFNVLILSHDVGGIGLNITTANHVIHYTRPWNPAKENQGTDRSHRIGQALPVTVHYPIVTDPRFETVEARLNRLLDGKRSLARDVLRPTKDASVSPEDLMSCLDEVT
jgi:SNF2 family DNA or RNA helicase